ncbi:MAG: type II toxin-antitoxin system RelB/DinJ family antitoxin [Clostridia bacterium]|nr:type II toxin-antitoxin system RelB/DinJ family antitoxin [Clostridia bacterium]
MADTFLQVRTNEQDKIKASEILAELGTNMSTVVNMLLKQIILTGGIPFDVVIPQDKKISKYRVKDLEMLLDVVPDSAEEVWVFGSTVTPYCRPQSDLDVLIIGNTSSGEEAKMYNAPDCAVDLLTATRKEFEMWSKEPGSVYKEVKEKGMLVYKRGKNINWK